MRPLSEQRITPRCGGVKVRECLYFVVIISPHGGDGYCLLLNRGLVAEV